MVKKCGRGCGTILVNAKFHPLYKIIIRNNFKINCEKWKLLLRGQDQYPFRSFLFHPRSVSDSELRKITIRYAYRTRPRSAQEWIVTAQ